MPLSRTKMPRIGRVRLVGRGAYDRRVPGDIKGMAARVSEAGGEILQAPQFMGDMVGWIAFFKDTEGNRVGIQQPA